MDDYDRAAQLVQEQREAAIARVLIDELCQRARAAARRERGLPALCEDCGDVIDAARLRAYRYATTCRECARGGES